MAHFFFPIDADFAAKNNELLKDTKRLQISAGLFGIIQILIGVGLYFWLGGAFGIICLAVFAIMALISFAMIFVVPKQVGNAQHLYDNYDLVPAMIAEVNPRDMVVMALVNTNVNPTLPPRWALATRNITAIPGIEGDTRKVGTRIPAVAVTGQRSVGNQDSWDQISPMPIAWATPDSSVIARAESTIPSEQWTTLSKNLNKLDQVRETKFDLLEL